MSEAKFKKELEIFEQEVEKATQSYYAELTLRRMAEEHPEVDDFLERTPLLWGGCVGALQESCIIALGRIFDKNSLHNLGNLLRLARNNQQMFSKTSLRQRTRSLNRPYHEQFFQAVYEPTLADFDRIDSLVEERRNIYETNYQNLRHRWISHKGVSKPEEVAELFNATNVDELKEIFDFLGWLHEALFYLFIDGRAPNLDGPFVGRASHTTLMATLVTHEAERFLKEAAGVRDKEKKS